MEYKKAAITAYTGNGGPVRLFDVPFHFSVGGRSLCTGVDITGETMQRAGWLGLQTGEFEGWQSTHSIELSYPNAGDSDHLLEVNKNFSAPFQDGEWLWFPAMPLVRQRNSFLKAPPVNASAR
ncbi:hypothetical protein [Pseudomonas fluorescens]|uniref:hypothetical protein n=1 Tax=Pseudomonas fluorescens TaxID=294 RepID=UPI000370AE9A|nr:hypothetical protein [Pseudomonas fluorescens]